MPKVDKIDVMIKNERKTFEVWYNAKEHFFIKHFPSEVERITGLNVNNQASMDGLRSAVRDALEKYHELTRQTRKVIAYRLQLSGSLYMNPTQDDNFNGEHVGLRPWVPQQGRGKVMSTPFGSTKHTIGLDYRLYIESTTDKIRYFEIKDRMDNLGHECRLEKEAIVIDWTEEREKGLDDIIAAMKVLAERIGTVLLDPEKTIQMLEAGIKLLK